MKCYSHQDIDAIAICKNCHRGLCEDCASNVGNGQACRNRCEDEVEFINKLLFKYDSEAIKRANILLRNVIYLTLIGLTFIFAGSFIYLKYVEISHFLMSMSIGLWYIFAAFSNYSLRKTLRTYAVIRKWV